MFKLIKRHKYKIAVFGLLAAASGFSLALAAARMAYSDTVQFSFLIKNLFLAWIPFVVAYFAYTLSLTRKLLYIVIPLSTFIWLIFFPNAPYMLTDLQHLATDTGNAPLWFDVILMVWFTWTGLLLGVVSLYLMQEIVRKEFGRIIGWLFVISIASLSSVGMYIGRFLRWNSWDIIQNPSNIASDILIWLKDPNLRVIAFTFLFSLFFLFIYLTLYAFGHILQEQKVENNS